MALPDSILRPIPGENPSGQNLRYDPIYEKVKEARREEDDLPQGEWSHAVKVADSALVVRLSLEALSNKSKDLQLAAWLTEALLREDGVGGLREGLDLVQALIQNFWDTLYPLAEDGDLELRAAPLNWVGSYLAREVRKVSLTRSDYDWFKYLESRTIGTEEQCAGSDAKMAARQAAIEEGKLTPEAFDEDVGRTPSQFYVQLIQDFDSALASLQKLDELCAEKLGRDSPSLGKLQESLEEVRSLANTLLQEKEPSAPAAQQEEPQDESRESSDAQAGAPIPIRKRAVATEPVDWQDAVTRIVAATNYLRVTDPCSPVPYLVLRALQWGDLLRTGIGTMPTDLEAPPSETRQKLKRLALEGQWSELLEASEVAMATPCGEAWLDVHRYVTQACRELGSEYDAVAQAIRSGVGALLTNIPDLPKAMFLDDTAVANAETLGWLQEITNSSKPPADAEEIELAPPPPAQAAGNGDAPDVEQLATQAAKSGRMQEAMELLTREIAQERSGRARFERKMQLARLCLSTGHEAIAYPILKELADEIESRRLEEWESPSMLASSLTLLFRCLKKTSADGAEKDAVYQRICRLDPVQALICLK
jgi:type VI secretion system protein ImpA